MMGLEEGARVMPIASIASVEKKNAKRVALIGKDVHALMLQFSDEKSTGPPKLFEVQLAAVYYS